MTIDLGAFQPCDIRGPCGPTARSAVSPEHAFLVGRALAAIVPADASLVVAGDGRASTPGLLAMLVAGFGRDCFDLGPRTPTPLAYFVRHAFGLHGVAIVTASHQPASHNGLKIQLGDRPAGPELIGAIAGRVRDMHDAGEGRHLPGERDRRIQAPSADLRDRGWREYLRFASRAFSPAAGQRVAVDPMHGAYAELAPAALRGAGYDVHALRDESRSDFAGIAPDPADDRQLEPLRRAVVEHDAAFGVALDGDGDRARIVDETGRPIDNGTTLVLLYGWLAERRSSSRGDAVVCDQKSRLAVIAALEAAGARAVLGRSGHAFLRTAVLETEAVMGGEVSGHFFWGDPAAYPVPAGDCGLLVAFAIGDLLRRRGRPLSELCDDVPASPWYTGDIRDLRYAGDRSAMLARMAATADRGIVDVSDVDGLRLQTAAAFAQIRPSVTEPDMLTAVLDARDRASRVKIAEIMLRLLPPDAREIGERIMAIVEPHGEEAT